MEAYRDALLIEQHLTDLNLKSQRLQVQNIDKNKKMEND